MPRRSSRRRAPRTSSPASQTSYHVQQHAGFDHRHAGQRPGWSSAAALASRAPEEHGVRRPAGAGAAVRRCHTACAKGNSRQRSRLWPRVERHSRFAGQWFEITTIKDCTPIPHNGTVRARAPRSDESSQNESMPLRSSRIMFHMHHASRFNYGSLHRSTRSASPPFRRADPARRNISNAATTVPACMAPSPAARAPITGWA
jgi:hypothetical protein